MEPRFFSSMVNPVYASLWNKYRPAIIQLMLASEEGAQQYRLFDHEFKALAPKEKKYSFELHAYQGKSVNNVKPSIAARNLLDTLNTSRKACELMNEGRFAFKLDKEFILHISRIN
ncbi:MAG: hypothetical protein HY015_00485 [Bacteroidetes bacterium]|nr:hypothetical protein [Bacteroidota bacterium]MBI3481454.1 hypothetical protein [Bacteroidota bacterium]